MRYRSKKDPNVTVLCDRNLGTSNEFIITYENGDNKGKAYMVTDKALEKYWEPIVEEDKSGLNLDFDQINTPYPEPTEQKYVPVPDSVKEYEAKKHKSNRNTDIPEFEDICKDYEKFIRRINEASKYVFLLDGTTIERTPGFIRINTMANKMEIFTKYGLIGESRNDKTRPLTYKLTTKEECDNLNNIVNDLMEDK